MTPTTRRSLHACVRVYVRALSIMEEARGALLLDYPPPGDLRDPSARRNVGAYATDSVAGWTGPEVFERGSAQETRRTRPVTRGACHQSERSGVVRCRARRGADDQSIAQLARGGALRHCRGGQSKRAAGHGRSPARPSFIHLRAIAAGGSRCSRIAIVSSRPLLAARRRSRACTGSAAERSPLCDNVVRKWQKTPPRDYRRHRAPPKRHAQEITRPL